MSEESAQSSGKSLKDQVKELLEEMKVTNIQVIDLEDHTMFDAFVLGTCTSSRHLRSSAEFVRVETKKTGDACLSIEASANWVAMDMGVVGVHLFTEEVRELYDLEGLWVDGNMDVGLVQNYLKGN